MESPQTIPTRNPATVSENNMNANQFHHPVLKVVGLGGGGCNAICRMMELGLKGIEFVAANTDYQALRNNPAPTKIQLGPELTRGLGAGGNHQVGHAAARESARKIADALTGADMIFLTAGMGGGTGTGSIPIVAEIARHLGIVVISVVTMPFSFEMGRRQRNATEGIAQLRKYSNTLIAIPNDRLLQIAPRDISLEVAFRLADDVLRQAVQGITELITEPGLINIDFSHVKNMMLRGGGAYMSIGHGHGQNKAQQAIHQALHHPLVEQISIDRASGIIANFTGGSDLTLFEVQEALSYLQEQSSTEPDIIMGVTNDDRMQGRVQVILVITGMGGITLEEAVSEVSRSNKPNLCVEATPKPLEHQQREFDPMPVGSLATPAINRDLDIPAFIRRRSKSLE